MNLKMNNKTLILGLSIAALVAAAPARADEVGISLSDGVHRTSGTYVSAAYRKDVSPLFGLDSHVDFILASWSGKNPNDAISVSRSVHWGFGTNNYLHGGLGLAYVSNTNGRLGSHGQFKLHFGVGHRFGKYDLELCTHHYSNGGTSSPNAGENFAGLCFGREI